MVNNLKTIAKRAGFTGKALADERGVTPETVSRHMTGRVRLSLEDAGDYAAILGCTPEEILFDPRTVPVFGICDGNHTVTPISAADGALSVTFNLTMTPDVAAIIKRNGASAWNNGTIYFIPLSPVKEKSVDPRTTNRLSVYRKDDDSIHFGLIYPEPAGLFTISDPWSAGAVEQNLTLKWATPVLLQTYQNELLGVEEIDG